MKKKFTCGILLLFLVIVSACKKAPVHCIVEAKTLSFENLSDMEDFSTVIVKGSRKANEETIIKKSEGHVIATYTFSEFEISKIFKDEEGELESGSVITILENEAYDKDENIVYHVAGYHMMETGKEYLLFLKKYVPVSGDAYYVSAGVNYGTVSLQDDSRMTLRSKDSEDTVSEFGSEITQIWDAALDKYSQ